MIAFLSEAEAAEECPCGLVRGLGGRCYPFAIELFEGIAEYPAHRTRRGPARRRDGEGDFDIRVQVFVVERDGDDFAFMLDADGHAGAEVTDADTLADPSHQEFVRNGVWLADFAVMAEDQHGRAIRRGATECAPGRPDRQSTACWARLGSDIRTTSAISQAPRSQQRPSLRLKVRPQPRRP